MIGLAIVESSFLYLSFDAASRVFVSFAFEVFPESWSAFRLGGTNRHGRATLVP